MFMLQIFKNIMPWCRNTKAYVYYEWHKLNLRKTLTSLGAHKHRLCIYRHCDIAVLLFWMHSWLYTGLVLASFVWLHEVVRSEAVTAFTVVCTAASCVSQRAEVSPGAGRTLPTRSISKSFRWPIALSENYLIRGHGGTFRGMRTTEARAHWGHPGGRC